MCVYEDQVLIFARRFWCTDTVVIQWFMNIWVVISDLYQGNGTLAPALMYVLNPKLLLVHWLLLSNILSTFGQLVCTNSSILALTVFTIHSHSEFATACILSIWSYGKTILYFFLGEHAWQWGKWWVIKTLWETWVIKTLWETSAPRRTHHKLMLTIIGSFVFLMCLKLFSLPSMARLILSTLQHAMHGSYLEVRDGDSQDSVLVGRFCGSVPCTFTHKLFNQLSLRPLPLHTEHSNKHWVQCYLQNCRWTSW